MRYFHRLKTLVAGGLRPAQLPVRRTRRAACDAARFYTGWGFIVLKWSGAFILFLLIFGQVYGQTFAEYFQQANEAYQKKDYNSNVELLEKSIEAGGDHPMILYFLARGYALTGNGTKANETLNKLADLGISYNPERDPEFAAIHKLPEFNRVVERFRANLKPTNISEPAITITDVSLIPEGIAFDPSDQAFYFGGVKQRKIIRFKNGKFDDFSSPKDELWSVLGMKVKNGTLWVASTALEGQGKGKSGIFQYDLKTAKLLNKYILPGENHGLGEVVIASNGTVYATDSVNPGIYSLNQGKLELFLGPEPFRSPQGACLSEDQKILFVADYSRGIFAIDLPTKKHWKLSRAPGTTTLAGIDGLYCHGKYLIAIQNGVQPNRILQIETNTEATGIERVNILESNHEVFPEPTLGVIVEDDFYYVGNSMIVPFLENPNVDLKPAVILKLPHGTRTQ